MIIIVQRGFVNYFFNSGLYWKTADVTLTQEYPKLLHTKDGIRK